MSTTQNLKFIHLSTGSASTHKTDTGAIIFEKASGRIAVADGTNVEYYGGGRIADAKFENKKLTLSFNDGSNSIVLDFSDAASASGVNAILGGLNDRITTLEGKVVANETAIQANTSDIADIKNETTGILAQAKKYADGKVGDIGTDVTVKEYVDTAKGAAIEAAKTYADATFDKKGSADAAKNAAIEAANNYTDTKVGEINTAAEALGTRVGTLEGKVSGLETTVGNASSGLVKKVNDNADAIADNADAIAAINHETTGILAQAKSYTDTAKGAAIEAAKSYTDTEIGKVNTTTAGLRSDVDALKVAVGNDESGLVKKVADLSKLHADKTDGTGKMTVADEAKAAAVAEVAKVVASAPADFDTLKEIADWIANDKDGAAAMQSAIGTLKTTVGDKDSGLVKGVADNKSSIDAHNGRITKLEALHAEGTHDGYSTVAEEVKAGIAGIAEASVTSDDGTDVKVTVKTNAGSVSDVIVDASVLAGKVSDNATAIATETARAKKAEGDLSTTITGIRGDLGESDATASAATAFGRIKALEEKQTSGTLMWSVWD